jgi:hypothetical protein
MFAIFLKLVQLDVLWYYAKYSAQQYEQSAEAYADYSYGH